MRRDAQALGRQANNPTVSRPMHVCAQGIHHSRLSYPFSTTALYLYQLFPPHCKGISTGSSRCLAACSKRSKRLVAPPVDRTVPLLYARITQPQCDPPDSHVNVSEELYPSSRLTPALKWSLGVTWTSSGLHTQKAHRQDVKRGMHRNLSLSIPRINCPQ